ncbi:MAG TPA: hypothetical protein P5555_15520, partial [Candidatus Paceibacterota bacterium]|nr:hypothetical protein [Verrucomicrobiota bacterium]HRZ46592.1 hypothetical protein [Candidatus Paceibacterota bacterium]HRZ91637.1 hypothetical protein [Candidatus Paceibacterota bacterium]
KRIRRWHGRWLLIAAVLGLSVGGSGQWTDRYPHSFPSAILDSLSTRPYSAFPDLELPYLQWRGYVQEGVRMT